MMHEHGSKALVPVDFKFITEQIPELKHLNCNINFHSFKSPIDSSNVSPEFWEELADVIGKNYNKYDGFVILHGTDTMAYTASALSFMMPAISKPVILTGSQLPLGMIRTDAKRNLITTVEIVSAKKTIPEVCIYFNSKLFRGNRCEKFTSSKFDAFHSLNYPPLAEAGVNIEYNEKVIRNKPAGKFSVIKGFNKNVIIIKLFPGIQPAVIDALSNEKNIKAVILETFGSGNAPSNPDFTGSIERIIKRGIIVINVSQCSGGEVVQGKYETSVALKKMGVISADDMTTEAAITKTMFLLDKNYSSAKFKELFQKNIAGEKSGNGF